MKHNCLVKICFNFFVGISSVFQANFFVFKCYTDIVKISANNINFKGYDALPLKKLHIASSWGKIEDELSDVSKREGFEVKTSLYNGSFNQDCKVILERDKKPILLMEECGDFFYEHVPAIMLQYGMNAQLFSLNQRNLGFVQGGNFFIGKYPNGESNELMDNLIGGAGGIHCMSLEEPNFDAWV